MGAGVRIDWWCSQSWKQLISPNNRSYPTLSLSPNDAFVKMRALVVACLGAALAGVACSGICSHLNECSGHGHCNALLQKCDCDAGYGADSDVTDLRSPDCSMSKQRFVLVETHSSKILLSQRAALQARHGQVYQSHQHLHIHRKRSAQGRACVTKLQANVAALQGTVEWPASGPLVPATAPAMANVSQCRTLLKKQTPYQ